MQEVAEQTMAVTSERNQIAAFIFGDIHDFNGRIAQGQFGGDGDFFGAQFAGDFFQIGEVGLHLFGFGELQGIKTARGKAVGDVQQKNFLAEMRREFGDVRHDAFVRRAVVESNEDFLYMIVSKL